MINKRQFYLDHIAQTSTHSACFEVDRAQGVFLYDKQGKRYFDLNSGIAVSSIGHGHPRVLEAIRTQSEKYLHTMVYGEHIQAPMLRFAQTFLNVIDRRFDCLYYVMTGSEATELAMKLAKRFTGRKEIISCRNAYHGSTQGAESLRSDQEYLGPYRPLIPGIRHIRYNSFEDVQFITSDTAAVLMEVVQGEAGVISPKDGYLHRIRERCIETGTLLIFDEIQSGFGRTGELFAHQKYQVVPDLFTIGKAMGGGMPLAAVVATKRIMSCLTNNPDLGHLTTFGGHPMSCAAAAAALEVLLDERLVEGVADKSNLLKEKLSHPIVREIRGDGLMMAVELKDKSMLNEVIEKIREVGVFVDWFLFNDASFRVAPPLIISEEEICQACELVTKAFDEFN